MDEDILPHSVDGMHGITSISLVIAIPANGGISEEGHCVVEVKPDCQQPVHESPDMKTFARHFACFKK